MPSDPRHLFGGIPFPVIGMIHLSPLPGSPRSDEGLADVIADAVDDAIALAEGGGDAVMIENYGDLPFHAGSVGPETVAAMTAVAIAVRSEIDLPLGVNVLRNDPLAALAVAAAVGGEMIRVNVHTGTVLTDQGVIQGEARRTLDLRRRLGSSAMILADVRVKHAAPLADRPIEEEAADAAERGLADALIVSGARTGGSVDLDRLRRVREAVDLPVLVGSGATLDSIDELRRLADGAIVGTWFKEEGRVSRDRVRRLMERVRG